MASDCVFVEDEWTNNPARLLERIRLQRDLDCGGKWRKGGRWKVEKEVGSKQQQRILLPMYSKSAGKQGTSFQVEKERKCTHGGSVRKGVALFTQIGLDFGLPLCGQKGNVGHYRHEQVSMDLRGPVRALLCHLSCGMQCLVWLSVKDGFGQRQVMFQSPVKENDPLEQGNRDAFWCSENTMPPTPPEKMKAS